MGCTSSKGKFETAGNLLVDGFLRYTQMSGQGWTKTKSSNGRKEIHLEVYQADAPLGTWRGFVFLDGVSLEDTLAYVKAKLGTDNYELLETDDDEWIFRELFDFNIDGEGKEGLNPHAGDHRGETAERMEGGIVIHDPRKTNLKGNARSHEKILEEPGGVSERDMSVSERDVSQSLHKESPIEGKNDDDDSSSDEEEEPKKKSKEDNSKEESVFEVNASLTNLMDDPQKSTKNFNWSSILFSSSRKTITKKNAKQEPSEKPANREMIFKRQDFGLGMSKAVVIAQSAKYNKRVTAGAKRCTVHMLGCQLEEFIERKKPRVKLTFVCSIDPDLAPWEKPLATEEALSLLGGKLRVERFLTKAADYFAIPSNKLINRFRNIAAAPNGEMGWEEVERSKNELQLGTNVQHPTYGHGVVQSFDMKGRVRVVYDSKTTVDHEVEEKDDLRVTVIIGTRVVHPERGAGTVKAFDELGRIHVKFDNGDLHRYKQDAWKKKMNTVKLMGIGGALGTVKLSWRPYENIREGMGRVKFAVGVSTEAVLEYILESNSQHSDEDLKSGTVLERRVVEKINDHERIIYENRKMPPPLTPRDFVFKEIWCEVAPKTYVILYESVTLSSLPDNPRTVRGELHLTGWLLEPLYLNEESYDGDDHICKITYQMCVDVKGFVSPDSVEAVRQGQLLAALTDTRAYFWAQSQQKQKAKLRNRQSKRMSGFAPPEEKSIQGNLQGGMKKMASKLIM